MRSPQATNPDHALHLKTFNVRLAIVGLATASVGLSMVIISSAKLLLILCGLMGLLFNRWQLRGREALAMSRTSVGLLASIAALALSLLWTEASLHDSLASWGKYGKLLVIPLLLVMIQTKREAHIALAAFVAAQLALVLGSWMLFFQWPVPWASSNMARSSYAVFSSYLDQGIMGGVFAAVCWHLRNLFPGRHGSWLAIAFAVLALTNVFFVLGGRTGHVVAIVLISMAIMWELPRRFKLAAVAFPFVLVLALTFGSSKVHQRVTEAVKEVQSFSFRKGADIAAGVPSSSGIRLHFWHRAVQSIGDHPLAGAGIGSWSSEYNRLERAEKPSFQPVSEGNPHQEYLLWGVHLGIPGVLVFFYLLFAIFRDSGRMDRPCARATQSVLLALAVACAFNSSLYDALIGDFFCVLLGLLLALGTLKEPTATGDVQTLLDPRATP